MSPRQPLDKANFIFQQKMIVTELDFTSPSIHDAKLDITLHFVGHANNPVTIKDIGYITWNKLIMPNQDIPFTNFNITLGKGIKLPGAVFDQTELGFDEILFVDEQIGLVRKIGLKDFKWKKPEFRINKENNSLEISVDYPIDFSEYKIDSDKKLKVEIDGFDKSFIDNIRKFIKNKQWLIEETKNVTLELGENKFRIEMLRNTTELTVSRNSIANKASPIQVKSFGQWKPLEKIPEKLSATIESSQLVPSKDLFEWNPFKDLSEWNPFHEGRNFYFQAPMFSGFKGFSGSQGHKPKSLDKTESVDSESTESYSESMEGSEGPTWVGKGEPIKGVVVNKRESTVKIGKSTSQIKKENRKLRRARKQERKDKKRKNRRGDEEMISKRGY